jgi:hypothetical protein
MLAAPSSAVFETARYARQEVTSGDVSAFLPMYSGKFLLDP